MLYIYIIKLTKGTTMTMTYEQLTEMCNSLDEELTEVYNENGRLRETNHELKEDNYELQLTVGTLIKTVAKGAVS
tara:strand:+ start:1496 stop:1720 length:225 start_codon:yes stop_codon:yes gene_type:complete